MKNQVIGYCPICDNKLKVTKLGCSKCGTELSGHFHLSKFSYLKEDELKFVEVFVKNAGNMKQLQNELGVSYPTAKKMLTDVIESLGYETVVEIEKPVKPVKPVKPAMQPKGEGEKKLSKAEILRMIEAKEISPEEGYRLLEE
jgi:hypothetical protein